MVRDRAGFRRFYAYLSEVEMLDAFRDVLRYHGVSLLQVYSDEKGPSVHAARLHLWWWLAKAYGKSPAEIGRLFDRGGDSVAYGLKRLQSAARARQAVLSEESAGPLTRLLVRDGVEPVKE